MYKVKVGNFEGPFDLILYFVERDELDIYDIPIADLANDFLAYIEQIQLLNIELASEFILVASTLMRIKAKMLLPRKELDEEGNEIDPRESLVQRLIEYKRYKAVLEDLEKLASNRAQQHQRGCSSTETATILKTLGGEVEIEQIQLYKMLQAFNKVMDRFKIRKQRIEHRVVRFPYTIADQKRNLLNRLQNGTLNFEDSFSDCSERIEAIFRFLALLELIQEQCIQIMTGFSFNNFTLHGTAKRA